MIITFWKILINTDYKTILAQNGKEALLKISLEKPDLIISDIMMPEIDGFELFTRLKEISHLANIPFIFLTAKVEQADLRKGMGIGADDYITKPFRTKDLLNAVTIRLEKKKNIDHKFDSLSESIALYVPHELKTPLVAIMGYAEIIESNLKEMTETEILEMVNSIKEGASRLSKTIDKFLIYSELVLGQNSKAINKEYKDFYSAIRESDIIEIISDKVNKYGRSDDIIINAETNELKLYKGYLQHIIIQLIDNAFKFSTKGSTVKIEGKVKDGYYHLAVTDNGFGMTEEQINFISAFQQYNRSQIQQEGNGLGLVTIKKIIELIEGEIHIKSEIDKFTTVELLLPLH